MDYKKIAKQLITEAKELADLKGKKMDEVEALSLAIKVVEIHAEGKALSSEDKKGIALAIVKELLKSSAGKKYGLLIGLVVKLLNAIFGKKWVEKAE